MKSNIREIRINTSLNNNECVYLLPQGNNKIEARVSDNNTDSLIGSLSMKAYILPPKEYISGLQSYIAGSPNAPAFFIPVITFNFALMSKLGEVVSAGIKFNAYPANNARCVMRKFDNGTIGENISYDDDGYFDLTPVISSAVKGNVTLCIYNENAGVVKNFSSNENDDITLRPVLTVTYIPFESALTGQEYLESNAGEIACNIDILKGIPYISRRLLSLGGLKMPLNLSLNYNTKNVSDGILNKNGLPVGWLTDYNLYCYPETYTDDSGRAKKYYVYLDGQGQRHIFRYAQNSTALWADCRGTGLLLEETSNGTKIFDEDGNNMLFDSRGRLNRITQKMSSAVNAVTDVTYVDENSFRILSVKDGMNRTATFKYGVSSVTVSYNGVEKVTLNKDANGFIANIVRKSGATTETDNFICDTNGAVTSITASNGEELRLTFIDSVRISRLYCLQNDKTFNFAYSYLQTTVADNKGVTQIYNFNEDGEIINSYEKDGDGQSNIGFVDRDSCQYYSGILLDKNFNKFVFGCIPALMLDNVTEPKFYMSQSLICYNVTVKDFAVFSARVKVENAYKQTVGEASEIRIELWDSLSPENKLCELKFNPFAEGVQIAAKPFVTVLDRDMAGHLLKLKIYINCRAAKITLFGLCLGPMNSSVNRLCCNKYLSYGSYPNIEDGYYMDTNTGVDFGQGVSADGDIILHTEDYLANAKNYQTRVNGKWNFWYDRKRKVVAGVTDATVNFANGYSLSFSDTVFNELTVNNSTDVSCLRKTYSSTGEHYLTVRQTDYNDAIDTKENYYYYDFCYNLIKSQNDRTVCQNTYNTDGYLTREKTAMNATPAYNIITDYTYSGNYPVSEKNYLSSTVSATSYGYDAFGNMIKTTAPNSFVTDYAYDTFGDRLESVSGTIDGTLNKNGITYSGGKVVKASHNGFNYEFGYDSRGNINTVKINNTQYLRKTYTYTDNTDTVLTYYGSDTIPHGKIYDKYNRLVKLDGSTFIYSSPTNEKELKATYSATNFNSAGFPVNSASLLYKVIDKYAGSETKYRYNILNNITSVEETLANGKKLEYGVEYNARNLPDKVTYSYDGAVIQTLKFAYGTDSMQSSSEVKSTTLKYINTTMLLTTEKDKLDRIAVEKYTQGYFDYTKSYTYYEDNTHTDGTTNFVKSCTTQFRFNGKDTYSNAEAYEYDKNRNITKRTHTRSGTSNETTYVYDGYNRLTRENNQALGKSWTYSYDAGGNIMSKREYAYTAGTLGTAVKTYSYTYGNGMKDRLTAWNGKSFAYDSCGNPTKYKGDSMSWQRGRLLSSYTKGGKTYTFNYDINGIRRKKTAGTDSTEYLISDGKLIQQNNYTSGSSTPASKIVFLYSNDGITGCVINNWVYKYEKDISGNVVSLLSGTFQVARYEYDAWGNCKVLNPNGTENTSATFAGNINPIRYRSYYYDSDIGLYYLQTRYYDPETGRFINLDQIEYIDPEQLNGLNLYAYCLNNPVMNVDPSGHFVLSISAILTIVGISAGVGALFGLGSAVVKDLENGKLFDGDVTFRTYIGKLFGGAIAGAGIGVAVALGAGVGVAVAAGEMLTIGSFAISGMGAFAISAGASAFFGGLGYVARTTISDQEDFNWNDMFTEISMNALSGITSFIGGYVGGVTGLKIPGTKLGIKKFLLFHGTSLLIGGYAFKIAWLLAKYALKKEV